MRRLTLLFAVATAELLGQCGMRDQTTCGTAYPGAATSTPTLANFLGPTQASFDWTWASIASLPQPATTLTAQIMPCSVGWMPGGPASFGPYITTYMAGLKLAGVTVQECNLWPAALSSAAEYSGGIASDCAGGALLADGAVTVPSGTGPNSRCRALAYYDGMFLYAAAHGIQMRVGWFMGVNPATGVGLCPDGSGGYLVPGSMTEAQYEGCVLPLVRAGHQRWGAAITAAQPLEEPGTLGGMGYVQVFSVADVGTFLTHASAAIKAISPTTLVGAAALGSDAAYWADWTVGPTAPALDFLALDIFSNSCLPAGNIYGLYLANLATNFVRPGLAAHKIIRVGQADHPIWCPSSGAPTQATAIAGAGADLWRSTGMQIAWERVFSAWASASGISSVTIYVSLPLLGYSTDPANDNPVTNHAYAAAAMQQLAVTDAGVAWKAIGLWPAASMQGRARLTGAAHIGH